jgi:steroid delta-isomerase-like uncharacterized protein
MKDDRDDVVFLKFMDCINRQDWDAAVALVHDDFEGMAVCTGTSFTGAEGWRSRAEGWARTMPDGIMEATRVIKSGEWVVIEGTFSGTQEGTLTLGRHTVPPTGKPLSFQYCTIAQEVDGKILSEAVYYDLVTIFEQLNGDTAEQASA